MEHDQDYEAPPGTVLSQVPKPGTLIEEQNIVNFVVSGPAGSDESPSDETAPVQYASLEYTVPMGRFDREVSVLVRNAEGVTEMYRQVVPPGNRIDVQIPVVGETVAEVYLDGVLDVVKRMNSE